jgi:glycosyltransferase involved in cell wall biosynthesis
MKVRDHRLDGVSVVIPAYNEERAIEQTIQDVQQHLEQSGVMSFQIIVVDDGSEDRTAELAAKTVATVLSHPHNGGYGRALKTGIRQATYDTVVITDADGTYPINRISNLLDSYDQGFDMVVGERTGRSLNPVIYKGWLRKILKFLVEYSAGRKINDVNSGLRVFSKAKMLTYTNHLCNTFSFTTSATLAYLMTGMFVKYIKVEYYERIGDSKVKLFIESLRALQYIIQAIIYYNPLKLFLLMSAVCLLGAFVTLVLALLLKLNTGLLLGAGMILVSLIVFALGLLADLLRHIMASRN